MILRHTLQTPWKSINEMRRYGTIPLTFLYFRLHGIRYRADWRIYGLPLIQRFRDSRIVIGQRLQMRNWLESNPLGALHRTILSTRSAEAEIIFVEHCRDDEETDGLGS